METLDSLNLQDSTKDQELVINTIAKNYLNETARWAKFLSILGFVAIGFMVIAAFSIGTIFSLLGNNPALSNMSATGATGVFSVIYIGIALLYFFPTLYLFQFSSKAQMAIKTNNPILLADAFEKHKSVYKFIGIMSIVILSFYALILGFAFLAFLIK